MAEKFKFYVFFLLKSARDLLLCRNFIVKVSESIGNSEFVLTEETAVVEVVRMNFRLQNPTVDDKVENNWQFKFWPKRHKWSIIDDTETVVKCNKS